MSPEDQDRRNDRPGPAPDAPPAGPAGSIDIDRKGALDRLLELISITALPGEEAPVRDYILAELHRLEVPRERIRADDSPSRISLPCQTGNLIVNFPGTSRGSRLLLLAHMDTVPLAKNAEPVVRGDRIVPMGRTALGGDDRTGIAALLTALEALLRLDLPHPPLTLLFTIREETGLRGSFAVRPEDLDGPLFAFNFDGGCPDEVTIGATGSMRLEIDVHGLAAHAGVHPERGISAASIFAAAAAELERDGWLGLIRRPEGTGSSNIGAIQGGDATNVVMDRLTVRAEARSHDPEFLRRIVEEYRRAFAEAARSRRNDEGRHGDAELHVEESYASYRLAEDASVVQAALAAARAAGLTPRTRISNGGLDANWISRKGIPAVSLGCGQHEIHTTDEYVHIEEYLAACRIALELMKA